MIGAKPLDDVASTVWSFPEIRHRCHVAPLGWSGLLEENVEELIIELR